MNDMNKKLFAEMLGTAWLVLGGCGTAVLAGSAVGTLGISIAFGLSVITMAYAVGHISGAHFNPAVTIGLAVGGKFCKNSVVPYVIAQVVGAVLAAWIICYIAGGKEGFDIAKGFASNGFGENSPGGYSMKAAYITEGVMTFFFLFVIFGVTSEKAPAGFAPLAIGLSLTLIHLISIPVTNTSVNPARSTGQAFMQGGWAMDQLWLFWVAPIVGAVVAGFVYKALCSASSASCSASKGSCGK